MVTRLLIPLFGKEHCARRDRVDRDLGRERAGECFRQHDDAGLADAVRYVARPRLQSCDVRHVHDLALGAAQVGDGALRHEKHRPQVEIERRIPALGGHILDPLLHHDRGGVDEDVEPVEAACGRIGESAGCVRIAQIGLEQLGAAAGRAHGTGRVLGAFRRAMVMDGDIAPRLRQPDRNRLADPCSGTRDQRGGTQPLEPH